MLIISSLSLLLILLISVKVNEGETGSLLFNYRVQQGLKQDLPSPSYPYNE